MYTDPENFHNDSFDFHYSMHHYLTTNVPFLVHPTKCYNFCLLNIKQKKI